MTGQQQRHQLIAQLKVGHRLAVFVAGQQQHREDVFAGFKVGGIAVLGDHAVELRVNRVEHLPQTLL
ncbi:unannotated protein [freshwater metagenome]|uniref:Unannotated protein n=1 Tax=freshwater metagenome TaxID=449393 RepID=A0A6J7S3X1_9ZZZZ